MSTCSMTLGSSSTMLSRQVLSLRSMIFDFKDRHHMAQSLFAYHIALGHLVTPIPTLGLFLGTHFLHKTSYETSQKHNHDLTNTITMVVEPLTPSAAWIWRKDWLNAMSSAAFTSLALHTAWWFAGQAHMLQNALSIIAMRYLAKSYKSIVDVTPHMETFPILQHMGSSHERSCGKQSKWSDGIWGHGIDLSRSVDRAYGQSY